MLRLPPPNFPLSAVPALASGQPGYVEIAQATIVQGGGASPPSQLKTTVMLKGVSGEGSLVQYHIYGIKAELKYSRGTAKL